jgi:hypothetical protein
MAQSKAKSLIAEGTRFYDITKIHKKTCIFRFLIRKKKAQAWPQTFSHEPQQKGKSTNNFNYRLLMLSVQM